MPINTKYHIEIKFLFCILHLTTNLPKFFHKEIREYYTNIEINFIIPIDILLIAFIIFKFFPKFM
jgi:hypothetical protein